MPPITTCMQQSRQAVGASDILQISFQSESRLQQHGVISAVPYMSGFIFRFAVLFLMEDDLNFFQIEDDIILKFVLTNSIFSSLNGTQPQYSYKWKTTSNT